MTPYRLVAAVCLLVALGACGGSKDQESATTTTMVTTTTEQTECLRVSKVFEAQLDVRPASALGAVIHGAKWLVASADGAVWLVSVDPTAGVEQKGTIIPLNAEARTTSRFGSAVAPDAPATMGLDGSEPDSLEAKRCARKAEDGES